MLLHPIADNILAAWGKPRPVRCLHNALFCVQGWSLTVLGQPLLEGNFVATEDGPVHPAIQQRFAALEEVSHLQAVLELKPLLRSYCWSKLGEFLSIFGSRYGSMTGKTAPLFASTPFLTLSPGTVIDHDAMRDGFTALLDALRPGSIARNRDIDSLLKDPWNGLFWVAAEHMTAVCEAEKAAE